MLCCLVIVALVLRWMCCLDILQQKSTDAFIIWQMYFSGDDLYDAEKTMSSPNRLGFCPFHL